MVRALLLLLLTAVGTTAGEPFAPAVLAKLGSDRFRYPGVITDITPSPDGKFVAVHGSAPIWVYEFATGRPVWRMPPMPAGGLLMVYTVAFRGDQLVVLAYRFDKGMVIEHYGLHSPHPIHTTTLKDNIGSESAFSPDGLLLAFPEGRRVTLVDTLTGREANRIPLPRGGGRAEGVHFSPNGRRLAVQSDKGTVFVYDCLTGRELARPKLRPAHANLTFSPDGNRLSVAVEGGGVESLDLLTGARQKWKAGDQGLEYVLGLNDNQLLALGASGVPLPSGASSGTGRVFDAATGRLVRTLPAAMNPSGASLEAVALTPDGRTLIGATSAAAIADGTVLAWDLATGRRLPQSADGQADYTHFRFHGPDRLSGLHPAGSAGDDLSAWTHWQLPDGRRRDSPPRAGLHADDLSRDGLWTLATDGGRVSVVNTVTRKPARTLDLPDGVVPGAAWFRADDREVGVRTADEIFLWDFGTNRTRRAKVDSSGAESVMTSAGRWFALVESVHEAQGFAKPPKSVLRVFDLDTGRRALELEANAGLDEWWFTPDGSRLVRHTIAQTVGRDATTNESPEVHVLDPATGRVIRKFTTTVGERVLDISHDGRTILIAADHDIGTESEGSVAATEVATGKVRWRLPAFADWTVTGGGFAPDGRRLAVGTTDGFVRVWNLAGAPTPVDALAAARRWDDLAGPDAEKAFAAVVALGHAPEAAVPLLRAKIVPAAAVAAASVDGWLRDLDSPVFAVRRDATRNLRPVATRVRPAMELLLKSTASPEARDRLTDLLTAATRPSPDEIKAIRAAEVLERIATDPAASAENRAGAIEVLRWWAAGADGAALTAEAKETLSRLRR